MKMRSYNFCHTNTKNPGNNLGIFCLITGRPKLNGYVFSIDVQSQKMKLSFWENIEMTVNVTVNHPLVNGNVVVERFDGQGM